LLTLFLLLVVAWVVLAVLRIVRVLALLLRWLIPLIVLPLLLFLVFGVHLRTPFHLIKTLGKGETSYKSWRPPRVTAFVTFPLPFTRRSDCAACIVRTEASESDDTCALACERSGGSEANAAGSPRDNGDLIGKLHACFSFVMFQLI
jgi:hypothetical protein